MIGFPLGANATEIKVAETDGAVLAGAEEVDMVINVGALKSGDYEYVERDIRCVAQAAHRGGALLKVILETALLDDKQKAMACTIAKLAGADFVKTSTGFSKSGATAADIALMRSIVGPGMGVKASGGIRTFLSRMARRTLARRPMSQLSRITESSTSAPEWTRTFRDSTELRTVPPERIQALETIESMACPRRSSSSKVNLAGASG